MKRILIIKLSALGDMFLALPHIAAICRHHPHDAVHLMTGPSFLPLFEHHPRLRSLALDRKRLLGHRSAWARTWWTRRQHFDLIYDLQGNRLSRRLVRFSRAATRVGPQPHRVYTHHPLTRFEDNPGQSVFDRFNDTLVAGGVAAAHPEAELYLSPEDRKQVEAWQSAHGLTMANYVLFHAGSSTDWPSKRWPAAYFQQLAAYVQAKGLHCIWIGGPEDREVNQRLAQNTGIDATETFSFLQLYYLARKARFAVTNDSGPMHIIAAAGIPVYAFFGPTSWERSHAAGQRERVLTTPVPCRPCHKGSCPPDGRHRCLDTITPEVVIRKIEQELKL